MSPFSLSSIYDPQSANSNFNHSTTAYYKIVAFPIWLTSFGYLHLSFFPAKTEDASHRLGHNSSKRTAPMCNRTRPYSLLKTL